MLMMDFEIHMQNIPCVCVWIHDAYSEAQWLLKERCCEQQQIGTNKRTGESMES